MTFIRLTVPRMDTACDVLHLMGAKDCMPYNFLWMSPFTGGRNTNILAEQLVEGRRADCLPVPRPLARLRCVNCKPGTQI